MTQVLLEVERVGKAFVDGAVSRSILSGLTLSIDSGELVCIVGPSGCGKTTLLSIMAGLDMRFDGDVRALGRSLRAMSEDDRTRFRADRFGFVFQSFHLLEHLSVGENVAVPLWLKLRGMNETEERSRVREALSMVGLADRHLENVRRLSGGERQRVAIARALVHRPAVLFADEPTGNLDEATADEVGELFGRIAHRTGAEPCCVVIATHDRRLARRANRILNLEKGQLEEVTHREAFEVSEE